MTIATTLWWSQQDGTLVEDFRWTADVPTLGLVPDASVPAHEGRVLQIPYSALVTSARHVPIRLLGSSRGFLCSERAGLASSVSVQGTVNALDAKNGALFGPFRGALICTAMF